MCSRKCLAPWLKVLEIMVSQPVWWVKFEYKIIDLLKCLTGDWASSHITLYHYTFSSNYISLHILISLYITTHSPHITTHSHITIYHYTFSSYHYISLHILISLYITTHSPHITIHITTHSPHITTHSPHITTHSPHTTTHPPPHQITSTYLPLDSPVLPKK